MRSNNGRSPGPHFNLGPMLGHNLQFRIRRHPWLIPVVLLSMACSDLTDTPLGVAMASGTTVVSTTDGGHAEFLRQGENCLTFRTGDANGLASALVRLRESPDLSRRLARSARGQVERDFTLAEYVGRLEPWLLATAVSKASYRWCASPPVRERSLETAMLEV